MQPSTTDRSTAKQALLEALLSDAGLKNLTQTASTVMGNPVLVVDPVYRYGARGGFELDDADDPPFAAITRAELSEGDMLQDEAVRYIIERDLDEKIARSTGPLTRYNDMFCLNTMTGAIKVHGTCLGRAMMIERNLMRILLYRALGRARVSCELHAYRQPYFRSKTGSKPCAGAPMFAHSDHGLCADEPCVWATLSSAWSWRHTHKGGRCALWHPPLIIEFSYV